MGRSIEPLLSSTISHSSTPRGSVMLPTSYTDTHGTAPAQILNITAHYYGHPCCCFQTVSRPPPMTKAVAVVANLVYGWFSCSQLLIHLTTKARPASGQIRREGWRFRQSGLAEREGEGGGEGGARIHQNAISIEPLHSRQRKQLRWFKATWTLLCDQISR